jgi:hypothetical protein
MGEVDWKYLRQPAKQLTEIPMLLQGTNHAPSGMNEYVICQAFLI